MTGQRAIGFGIVGVGMIAAYHARAIQAAAADHGLALLGVAARDADKARQFADRHGIGFSTASIGELLALPGLDVVCIATPSGAHLEPALAAIKAGKHVLVEKPLEINLERVDAMLAAADAAGVLVCPVFQARFTPAARAIRAALDAGRFGALCLASAYVKWHRSAAYYTGWKGTLALDGGGAVINQAIHALDLLTWYAGAPVETRAWTTRRTHLAIEAEDTACAMFRFPGGALGVLEASTAAYPGWERRIELCGQRGSVALEDDRIVRWEFAEPSPGDAAMLAQHGTGAGSGAGAPDQIGFAGHQAQIEELAACIRSGAPLSVSSRDARQTVACVRAIYDAAQFR